MPTSSSNFTPATSSAQSIPSLGSTHTSSTGSVEKLLQSLSNHSPSMSQSTSGSISTSASESMSGAFLNSSSTYGSLTSAPTSNSSSSSTNFAKRARCSPRCRPCFHHLDQEQLHALIHLSPHAHHSWDLSHSPQRAVHHARLSRHRREKYHSLRHPHRPHHPLRHQHQIRTQTQTNLRCILMMTRIMDTTRARNFLR